MNQSDIRKVIDLIEYENLRKELRFEFVNHGIKFYDKNGWGYIVDDVKHYVKHNDMDLQQNKENLVI